MNEWSVSKNKQITIQVSKFGYSFDLIGFTFSYVPCQCHAGLEIQCSFLGYSVIFRFEDKRHWDYVNHKWEELNSTE